MIHEFRNDDRAYEIDTGRIEVRRDGETQHVEPQVFDVLLHLIRHRERMVTKIELLDEIWGGNFVSESALTSRIKSVRRLVGDSGREQQVIRTIHGRGYQFVAPILGTGDNAGDVDAAAPVVDDTATEPPRRMPTGTVTFLFSDIEGSSRWWEEQPEAMADALARHDRVLHRAIEHSGGVVFSTIGDGVAAAFARAGDAVEAARSIRTLLDDDVRPGAVDLRVRMGLHTGEAVERDGDYFGPTVNRAARITAAAHGGQTLLSDITAGLVPDRTRLRDVGECRVDPAMTPLRLWQLEGRAFPPVSGATTPALPQLRTELVGRAVDLARVVSATSVHRLVSIVGTGGAGKTTLALRAAHDSVSTYPSGVVFAELASTTPGNVHRTVAEAANVDGSPAADPRALARHLARRRILIVLDNCEHVVDECADLVDALLDAGSDAHVLVTSREPLGVDGERLVRLGSLDSEAPRLFVARAARTSAELRLEHDDPRVIELCRRLDGLPLAIELAAAQLMHLGLDELVERIDQCIDLAGSGRSRGRERHLTLDRTIAWSYDLLCDESRWLFRQFGVFPGSFDLPAAEAVGRPDDAGDSADTVDVLSDLIAKSLVIRDAVTGRYRLLETVRTFAERRLLDADELSAAEERLRRHVVERATRSSRLDRWFSGRNAATVRVDIDNLRFAVERSVRSGHTIDALDVLVGCSYLFRNTMNCLDGQEWIRRLAPFSHEFDDLDRLWFAIVEVDVAQGTADHHAGRDAARRVAHLAECADHDETAVVALHLEALHLVVQDPLEAGARLDAMIDRAGSCADHRPHRLLRAHRAMAALAAGDVEGGTQLAEAVAHEAEGDGYDVFIAHWAAWTAGLIGRDPARVRHWITRQRNHLNEFAVTEPWMFDWSMGLVAAMDGDDGSEALQSARRRAEAEGHDNTADVTLAVAVVEQLAGRPASAAEHLGAVMQSRLNNVSHYVLARSLRSTLRSELDGDEFRAATERGARRGVLADGDLTGAGCPMR